MIARLMKRCCLRAANPLQTGCSVFAERGARRAIVAAAIPAWLPLMLAGCQGDPLNLLPNAAANGVVGSFYQQIFTSDAGGGEVWQVVEGTLPPGLSLNGDLGQLSGTPTEAGDFLFRISAVQLGLVTRSGEKSYAMTVQPRLILGDELPNARMGEPYSFQLDVTGGVPPYTFTMVGLPGGISFDEDTGELSGTPVAPEPGRLVQASVSDSGTPQQSRTEDFVFVVKPEAIQITTEVLSAGAVGVAYSGEVLATGGFEPYRWTIVAGSLPPGLSLPSNRRRGLITGTPTTADTYTFTIQVEDADDPPSVDSREIFIVIGP